MVGLVIPGLVIGPSVKVNVWMGIVVELAKLVMTSLFYSKLTVTVGVVFILVPEALTEVMVAGRVIEEGNTNYNQPVEDSLSLSTMEKTYKVLALTNGV